MANEKISQLTPGGPVLPGDQVPINRAGANFSILAQDTANFSRSGILLSGAADAYGGSIQSAINALPPAGGLVDATSQGASLVQQGTIDPGSKSVEILLGAYTYLVDRIVVRSGLRIAGTSEQTTIIQATNATTVALIMTLPANTTASGCSFERFRLYGPKGFNSNPSPSNSLDGFQFNARAVSSSQGGLWYAVFREVEVIGFGGNSWHFLGASAVGELGFHQFITFIDCTGSANGGSNGAGGNALRMEGAMYQFFFLNCQYDSATYNQSVDTSGGTTPNIFIGAGPGSGTAGFPYIIAFHGCTCQGREILVQVDGAYDVIFRKMHHEQGYGAYLITQGANGANVPTYSVTIAESSFNGNVGVNSGNGYILNVNTSSLVGGIRLRDNLYAGVAAGPDSWYVSAAPANTVQLQNNLVVGATNQLIGGAQVAAVVAAYDALAQGANITLTTIYTSPVSGIYEVEAWAVVTRAASSSSTLPTLGLGWTDFDANVGTGAPAFTSAQTGNTVGTTFAYGQLMINVKAGTPIQVVSYSYATSGGTSMQYAVHYRLKFLG